jgi:signal transduction histidine kinase
MRKVFTWFRAHPVLADWALAALVVAFSASQDAAVLALSAGLAWCTPARRRYPASACWTAAGLATVQLGFGWPPVMADLVVALTLYTLAAQRPRRQSVPALAACLLLAGVATVVWGGAYVPFGAEIAGVAGLVVTAWVLGDSAQRSRESQCRRVRAVEESAARLRQIERDLHDGAQVRLTAVAMMLGEVKESLSETTETDLDGVRTLVGEAHRAAKETLAELRDLARGIHPPVLDLGLPAALAALAETSPVPVAVTAQALGESSRAIEAIAYFSAAELLANTAKHSNATSATVTVTSSGGTLTLEVSDDGAGGAVVLPGGGLAGLRARVQTVDGRISVDSPPGGPTAITIQLPERA